MPNPSLDRIVMALSWNKQAKPTTKPVNTSPVVPTSRQYNRFNTREGKKNECVEHQGNKHIKRHRQAERWKDRENATEREMQSPCGTALKSASKRDAGGMSGGVFGWSDVHVCTERLIIYVLRQNIKLQIFIHYLSHSTIFS